MLSGYCKRVLLKKGRGFIYRLATATVTEAPQNINQAVGDVSLGLSVWHAGRWGLIGEI